MIEYGRRLAKTGEDRRASRSTWGKYKINTVSCLKLWAFMIKGGEDAEGISFTVLLADTVVFKHTLTNELNSAWEMGRPKG